MLSVNDIDRVKELMRVATVGRMISAVNSMLNDDTDYDITFIDEVKQADVETCMALSYDTQMYAVYVKGEGELNISMICLVSDDNAKKIASRLLCTEVNELDDLATSALAEFGNILLAGAFTNVLSNITEYTVDCTAPAFAIEAIRSIMQYAALEQHTDTGKLLLVREEINCKSTGIMINILFLFNPTELRKIYGA